MNIFSLLVIAALLYFVPAVVARIREHQNAGAIVLLNLFLGWTLLGWVVALVWAFTEVRKAPSEEDSKKCPACAEWVKREAVKCRFCGHELQRGLPPIGSGLPPP